MSQQPQSMQTAWILWLALLVSVGLYAVVVVVLRMQGTEPPPPADPMLGLVLPVTALGPAAASIGMGRVIKLGDGNPLTTWILRWALAESVSILGLVILFLGLGDTVGAGLLGAGGLLILVQPPSARELEALQKP